ncbi:MAG: S8 family peptidase [Saprospiraceae bacterium]|nr:S8 family peptidase [Saprospiraceae bacterium]
MEKQSKRYLITYNDGSISSENAASLLGVAKSKCKEGVAFMETESVPGKTDVLHFENLGVSTIELTEDEVLKLQSKEGILAVEEDLEMFAFKEDINEEKQFQELFYGEEILENGEEEIVKEEGYQNGYKKALLDVFSSLLDRSGGAQEDSFDLKLPVPSPVKPIIKRPQPVPWNISMVKAPAAWARGITGKGVKLAILDTGITAHPDLSIAGGVSFIPGSTSFDDRHGHGTHCAGIAAAKNNTIGVVGVAPNASLYAVKVLNDSGSGMSSWIIAGMEWCVRNRIKVASMSLGGASNPSVAYANAIKRCYDHGVVVVIASGNSFGSSFPWVCAPANSIISGVANASPLAVGAVDRASVIAGFSSRGGRVALWNQVGCVAPGVSINSTFLANGYRALSGTSMATPHVAGLAALIVQRYPGITAPNVKRRITTTSRDLGAAGFDITYGFGLINCDLATR